jgi:glycosyltransferase involved in cell wall biosynthesis
MTPVSVAIICHNYGRFLRDAIDSVLAQTLLPCEVVIVDDASKDKQLRVELINSYPRLV